MMQTALRGEEPFLFTLRPRDFSQCGILTGSKGIARPLWSDRLREDHAAENPHGTRAPADDVSFAGRRAGNCTRKTFKDSEENGLRAAESGRSALFPEVIEDVMFGPLNLGLSYAQARTRALDVLSMLGIANLAESISFRLSGGQKRLVSIACILAMEPEVILLDEPTTALDPASVDRLTKTIESLQIAKLIVSHDYAFLKRVCGRMVTIRDAQILALE